MLKDYQIKQIMFEEKNNFVVNHFSEYATYFATDYDSETNEWNLFSAYISDLKDDDILTILQEAVSGDEWEDINYDDVRLFRNAVDHETTKILRTNLN